MQLTRPLELLAPARNIDIGIAAIDCGADAVYIAGPAFGARKDAGNEIQDIASLCSYAHRFGARIFVAINTILYDDELSAAYGMLDAVTEAGADAVIIQDLALTDVARRMHAGRAQGLSALAEDCRAASLPAPSRRRRIPLHASTQCAIRTPQKAVFLEKLGFSRLVLERELSMEQIRAIREAVDCELEFFVHGALCVCYSGQCYMSEMISGRSANRGACIQACRSRYDVLDDSGRKILSDKSILSLKDLNLKHRLEALADSGITSFKIEGRLKNISYVKNIVRDYSLALDEIVARRPDEFRRASFGKVSGGFPASSDKTFNRGYTSVFIDGKRGLWACPDAAKSMGEEIGTVENVSPKKDSFNIRPAFKGLVLNNGDGLCFIDGSGAIWGFRADVCNGMSVKCKRIDELRNGVRIFRNIDVAFEKSVANARISRLLRADIGIVSEKTGDGFRLSVTAVSEDGRKVSRTFDFSGDEADNTARMKEMMTAQLSKSSGIFQFSVTGIVGDSLPFLPASSINAIRRTVAEALSETDCRSIPLYLAPVPESLPEVDGNVSYKDNVSNSVARALYERMGASEIEPAYELSHRPGAELMRTKYCIKYQLGLCPVQSSSGPAGSYRGGLRLVNNGRTFPLEFDCAACEMIVKG